MRECEKEIKQGQGNQCRTPGVKFWANTVVFWANTFFLPNTVVFWLGPQQNQGKGFYREAGFTEWSCVCTLSPDQEEAPAWQRQSGPGAEIDSCSCLGMCLTGTGSGACWAETVQRGSSETFLVLLGNG